MMRTLINKKILTLIGLLFNVFITSSLWAEDHVGVVVGTTANANEWKIDVSLENLESSNYTAFQMDLVLPDGVRVQENTIEASSRLAHHTLTTKLQDDGTLRIAAYSLNNTAITGNTGSLVSLLVTLDNATQSGTFLARLTNVRFSKRNGVETTFPDASCEWNYTYIPTYTLTYMVDDEVYDSQTWYAGETIAPIAAPEKEGHTFVEWDNLPTTMPEQDVVAKARYKVNKYLLTFLINDETIVSDSVEYGTAITVPDAAVKEGHTFSGWQNVPATMPAQDVVVIGSYILNKYLLTFKIGDEILRADSVLYGATVTAPDAAVKEGHTFSGWHNVPKTMPAQDVVVTGDYLVNKYLLTFKIGDEIISSDSVLYGTTIVAPDAPVKEGLKFSGWYNLPTTMPAHDVTITGSYADRFYLLTFKIGDEVLASDSVAYGAEIIAPVAPGLEGHTFNGWQDVPATMPAHDLVITGAYYVNSYLLTFKIGDEVISSDSLAYGASIIAPEAKAKEGHTFSGWQNVPETMPAQDVVVTGAYNVNKYLLTFVIGDEVISSDSLVYGATVEAPEVSAKEGHTFGGWQNVPATMPAQDVVVTGAYSVNKYLITFVIGDEVISSDSLAYGATITVPKVTAKEGHTFSGWQNVPATMPAQDVVVTGAYSVNKYLLTFKIGDRVVASDSLSYGSEIVPPSAPEKVGSTFNGWKNLPKTMPDHDVLVTGSYSVNKYLVTYMIGDDVFATDSVLYGVALMLPEVPEKEGHRFNGWENVPSSMPAQDIIITGRYSVNKYLLTFVIGEEVISSDSLAYGTTVEAPEVSAKEGHTFSGWQNVPATMPAQDVVVTGAYSVNKYLLTFVIDDEVISSDSLAYGATVEVPEVSTKEGHTFSGWQNVPATMPAQDVVVTGAYSVNKYLITFKIGDEVISTDSLVYGAPVVAPEVSAKEGHTFSGWQNVPATMPAQDVVVTGAYSVNKYLLTFVIDDEVISSDSLAYGATVEVPEVSTKEGHTFSGWQNVPATMPAQDVVVTGAYSVNKYLITFVIGDDVISSDSLVYGAPVVAPEVSAKEGHTFSGWQNVPATMPAQDVVVTGAYSVNKYLITFKIGDEVISSDSLAYGATVEAPEVSTKEGYTFSGWQNVPATMPAKDVVVTGHYSTNKYQMTFVIGDEVISSDSLVYGAPVVAPEVPAKEGHTFSGWRAIPETMPAKDIVVIGNYTVNKYQITFKIGDEVYHTDSVAYGAPITAPESPTKEGYTFSGWTGLPDIMPAKDVTVVGSFVIDGYTLTYMVDGEVYRTYAYEYGSAIVAEPAPTKEGHTFSGWSAIPETMPAENVTITGSFTVNKYLVTFKIGDEVYRSDSVAYGDAIPEPEVSAKEGHTFSGWQDLPSTMPAKDIVVIGNYTVNKYQITFKIGDEVFHTDSVAYGAPITAPESPTKEGYTFSGWTGLPDIMPAKDVTVVGSFVIDGYTLTYMVDGEVYRTYAYEYGSTIVAEPAPTKEGHTFSGWSAIPETMPAENVTITGSFIVNKYLVTFKIGDEVYRSDSVAYGDAIPEPEVSVKEGHTFSGWQDLPSTMPAKDIVVIGNYTVNKYQITFKIGDEVFHTDSVAYGAPITAPESPTKEGYTFSGWTGLPDIMPAKDVTVVGSFVVDGYTLTYMVDGEVYRTYAYEYGSAIVAEPAPTKEGHTFSGWSAIPETMPAENVTITGSFTVNKYLVTFKIGDEIISSDSLTYGATVVAPEVPAKEGYTFSGWQNVPATMPAQDVVVTGAYSVNKYLITFVIGDEVISSDSLAYGATVEAPKVSTKEGYTFSGWQNVPATMPAQDVVVTGAYNVNKYLLTFVIDDEVISSDSLAYGAMIEAPEVSTKEGYTFSGWQNVPATMPAQDVVVIGAYSVNKYLLTFVIDDDVISSDSLAYGATISAPEANVKEGHTFSGWQNLPATMPAQDVVVTGAYSVNKYLITFVIDDKVISSDSLAYGATVEAPEVSTKEGHTFSGWQNVPATMPAQDVVVTGRYSANKYQMTFVIGDEVISSDSLAYGAPVVAPEVPMKEGHTFSGWQDLPSTMPAKDIVVKGNYTVNKYQITFKIGDEVFHTDSVAYGAPITAPESPTKEGYTFSGWTGLPDIMPAKDVTVVGSFVIDGYTLTYMVDGEVYRTYAYEYGSTIVAEPAPTKEGHTFSGWSAIPETMPAENVTITGSFIVNKYLVTFKIGDEVYRSDSVAYGDAIPEPEVSAKEGHTFSGWQDLPSTMPAKDVVVTGNYSVNKYQITFKIGEEVVYTDSVAYGDAIAEPELPTKEGYTFSGWREIPETMPAKDVTVTGSFTVNKYQVTFVIGEEVVYTDSVAYGDAIPEPELPTKEGYTFSGWQNLPETMPAKDIVVTGNYTPNKYLITFMVDDQVIKSDSLVYGTPIEEPGAPEKEGHTFIGWSPEVDEYVSASDVTYYAQYEVNVYSITYYLNDEVIYQEQVPYGTSITVYTPEQLNDGEVFNGWDTQIPETMPAHDLHIYGTTTISGLASVVVGDASVDVYALNGKLVAKSVKASWIRTHLKSGIYIINRQKVLVQ